MAKKWFVSALVLCGIFVCQPVMGTVTNDTAISESDPSSYYSGFDWSGVYQFGTSVGKTLTGVDPYWVLSSRHYTISVGNTFTANGTTYTVQEVVNHSAAADPNHTTNADLSLLRVDKVLPHYYDIFSGSYDSQPGPGYSGPEFIMVGSGHSAGTVTSNSYTWSDSTARKIRWGTNKIDAEYAGVSIGGYTQDVINAGFTLSGTTYEAGSADHDSGGGWFVYDDTDSAWELAGISAYLTSGDGGSTYNGMYGIDVRNYGEWAAEIVPEPTTLLLVAGGAVVVVMKRKRRRG